MKCISHWLLQKVTLKNQLKVAYTLDDAIYIGLFAVQLSSRHDYMNEIQLRQEVAGENKEEEGKERKNEWKAKEKRR